MEEQSQAQEGQSQDGQSQAQEGQSQAQEGQSQNGQTQEGQGQEGQAQDGQSTSASPPLLEYSVGAIVWAKIRGSPLWPSIVCCDPTNNLYYKYSAEKQTLTYHVRFCNYFGQRCWALSVQGYCTEAELLAKYPKLLIGLKKNIKEERSWAGAVEEANQLMKLQSTDRSKLFCSTYKLDYKEFATIDPAETAMKNNLPSTSSSSNAYNKKPVKESKQDDSEKCFAPKCDSPDCKPLYTLEQQKQLVIDTYGISIPPEKAPTVKFDLDNLVPIENYHVPKDLILRICQLEDRLVIEEAEAKRQMELELAAKAARKKAKKPKRRLTPVLATRRGRRPKSQLKSGPVTKPAAKRGRKPKSQLKPGPVTKPAAKRGRKPKSQLEPGLVTDESDAKSQLEPGPVIKPAEKRGRIPKSLLESGLVTDVSDTISQLKPGPDAKPAEKRCRIPKRNPDE